MGKKVTAKKSSSKYFRILSIDGGGIRGIIPAQVLVSLEEKLRVAAQDPDARLVDFFDMIAGTSTGGILACAYLAPNDSHRGAPNARPKFTTQDALNFYLERGDEVFHIPLLHKIRTGDGLTDEKYPAEGLERLLAEYFGDLKLNELIRPCLITAYDIRRRKTHFFTSHDALSKNENFFIKDVARATSAAPTYFEVAKAISLSHIPYPLIDGGIFANNPSLCAYAEARSFGKKPTAKDMVIVSLGTNERDRLEKYDYESAKDWGKLAWVTRIINIIMSSVAETVDYQLRQIYEAIGLPSQYVRIDPVLMDASSDMDDATPGNLQALRIAGLETARLNEKKLEAVAKLLTA